MAERPYDLAIVGAGQAGCILAGHISEKGVNPENGEPLKIALLARGPYYKGGPRPGFGVPIRRQMFTNVTQGFAGTVATVGLFGASRIVERHFKRG
jgi:2-polyprenyl-6-methoxyphenol hydroxylase-like FAD-dependent oxidoreductase